ncbi:MAG: tRNA pseudouridine(38-40) synthase TruA [Actinobacteria bacterium]|nr:tRNA pseudouridine(38-40) synthase TruA [Actinomycetota bacterium]
MSVVRLTLAYDGTGFRGWARQRGQRTVRGELEDALEQVLGGRVRLAVAGRTDAGVHARGQVASFEASDVDLGALRRVLNGRLAPEISVLDARRVPDGFHARFSATAREYRYRIDDGPWTDAPVEPDVWRRPGRISVPRMRAGAAHLVGEHDFASFCRLPPDGGPTTRRLERLAVSRRGDRVEVSARANAFLHQMVRAIVGTLVAVGSERLEPGAVAAILAARVRSRAPQMAPARGLTLERVVYGRNARASRLI